MAPVHSTRTPYHPSTPLVPLLVVEKKTRILVPVLLSGSFQFPDKPPVIFFNGSLLGNLIGELLFQYTAHTQKKFVLTI